MTHRWLRQVLFSLLGSRRFRLSRESWPMKARWVACWLAVRASRPRLTSITLRRWSLYSRTCTNMDGRGPTAMWLRRKKEIDSRRNRFEEAGRRKLIWRGGDASTHCNIHVYPYGIRIVLYFYICTLILLANLSTKLQTCTSKGLVVYLGDLLIFPATWPASYIHWTSGPITFSSPHTTCIYVDSILILSHKKI